MSTLRSDKHHGARQSSYTLSFNQGRGDEPQEQYVTSEPQIEIVSTRKPPGKRASQPARAKSKKVELKGPIRSGMVKLQEDRSSSKQSIHGNQKRRRKKEREDEKAQAKISQRPQKTRDAHHKAKVVIAPWSKTQS
jgi:hypothetical protein